MSYDYQKERPGLFTDEGQRMLFQIHARAKRLISVSGVARLQELISGCSGDTWQMLACVDRLVEMGELRELELKYPVRGQFRVFVDAKS